MKEFMPYTGEWVLWVSGQPTKEQRDEFDRKRIRLRIQHFKDADLFRLRFSFVVTRCYSKATAKLLNNPLKRGDYTTTLRKALELAYQQIRQEINAVSSDYFVAASTINSAIQNGQGKIKLHKIDYDNNFYRWEYFVEDRFPPQETLTVLRDLDKYTYQKLKILLS